MHKPVIGKSEKGGYYVFCEGEKQPWAAELKASANGETPEREWFKVRRARDGEAKAMGMDMAQCWAAIVPANFRGVMQIGGFVNENGEKGRAYYYFGEDKIVKISQEDALDRILGKVNVSAVAVSENEDDLPF